MMDFARSSSRITFIQSRDLRPDRYFPELHAAFLERLVGRMWSMARRDRDAGGLDFDALQLAYPAAARGELMKETLAEFVAFDVLPSGTRRAPRAAGRAPRAARRHEAIETPLHLTPMTRDATVAAEWLSRFEGAGPTASSPSRSTVPTRPGSAP
jgi:hypothetical protein